MPLPNSLGPLLLARAVNTTLSTTSLQASQQCKDIDHCRTIQSIIYSCLSTIFLCTWAALHLNVPKDSSKVSPLRHVWFMLGALCGPELVFSFAFFEWVDGSEALKNILDRYPDCAWTETHILFARMGGFRLVREDGTKETMYDGDIEKYLSDGTIDFPRISLEEIQERSKGDPVTKGIAVLQTAWFVFQCIHRASQRLPVTGLEITTLAHAAFNFLISWCWWNKPLNISLAIDLPAKKPSDSGHTEHGVSDKVVQQEEEREPLSAHDYSSSNVDTIGTTLVCTVDSGTNWATMENVTHVPSADDSMQLAESGGDETSCLIDRSTPPAHEKPLNMDTAAPLIPTPPTCLNSVDSNDVAEASDTGYERSSQDNGGDSQKVALLPESRVVDHQDKVPENLAVDVESLKVPGHSFSLRVKLGIKISAHGDSDDIKDKIAWSIVLFLLGGAFGAIHCLAWNSHFPTRTEHVIWQVSSLLVTVIGGGSFICAIFAPSDWDGEARCAFSTWGAFISALLYGYARVSLLLLSLLALRSLPYEAYVSPSWTSFIPHIN